MTPAARGGRGEPRRALIVGNWKMNGRGEWIEQRSAVLCAALEMPQRAEIVLCPPFVYLERTRQRLQDTPLEWGAQDLCAEEDGAHTGEVSAAMLADCGCRYVLVGHSERRALYGEDDALVARKYAQALRHALVPVLCIGENWETRNAARTLQYVEQQVEIVLQHLHQERIPVPSHPVLAYEPVWAIGTGHAASPQQAREVHAHLRALVAGGDSQAAQGLRVLYGGSVSPANAAQFLAEPEVDGLLVGGASLDAARFAEICNLAGGD